MIASALVCVGVSAAKAGVDLRDIILPVYFKQVDIDLPDEAAFLRKAHDQIKEGVVFEGDPTDNRLVISP